ncbi:MAG TPA: DUF969 family protein, partial [Xanthomonadaceae bacterium]|nr:DUF969 family protein [Xanthomonadaceae bacterium]
MPRSSHARCAMRWKPMVCSWRRHDDLQIFCRPRAQLVSNWPLIGVAVVVLGFALRLNPVMVVVSAGFASGFAAGKSLL